MKAAVIKGDFKVVVEDRPIPQVTQPDEVVCKVDLSALCGSDLHIYRGHHTLPSLDFTMGHEWVGTVTSLASNSTVKNFKVGDKVGASFTTSCGECFQCSNGLTSRCAHSQLFGSPALEGGQAEYIRVPKADSTLFHLPKDVQPDLMVLMCDIFPTGYFCAKSALSLLQGSAAVTSSSTNTLPIKTLESLKKVAVVLGCGPVGLCAITAAKDLGFAEVVAVDGVEERLGQATLHGATRVVRHPQDSTALSVVSEAVKPLTDGRGPDAILELVGSPEAVQMSLDLVRVGGVVASQGMQPHDLSLKGPQLYNKNIKLAFGRCPARAMYDESLVVFKKHQDLFSKFIQKKVTLDEAPEYYKLFNDRKVGKTVFVS